MKPPPKHMNKQVSVSFRYHFDINNFLRGLAQFEAQTLTTMSDFFKTSFEEIEGQIFQRDQAAGWESPKWWVDCNGISKKNLKNSGLGNGSNSPRYIPWRIHGTNGIFT